MLHAIDSLAPICHPKSWVILFEFVVLDCAVGLANQMPSLNSVASDWLKCYCTRTCQYLPSTVKSFGPCSIDSLGRCSEQLRFHPSHSTAWLALRTSTHRQLRISSTIPRRQCSFHAERHCLTRHSSERSSEQAMHSCTAEENELKDLHVLQKNLLGKLLCRLPCTCIQGLPGYGWWCE